MVFGFTHKLWQLCVSVFLDIFLLCILLDLPSGLGEVLQQPSHQHLLEYLRDLAPQGYPDYGEIQIV